MLQHPKTPLHTNGSENDIRACVTKRKISGGTMSTAGRTARDVLLGLMQTCNKLKASFFHYLGDRLHTPGAIAPPPAAARPWPSDRNHSLTAQEPAPVTPAPT